MSDEKWVTLTPEQVEALPANTWVRVCKGTTVIQGGIDSTDGHGRWMDVWIGDLRIKEPNHVEVREADAPKPDPQRLVTVRADGLTEPFVLRMAAVDIETMPLGWGGLPSSLPGTLRTLADAIEEHRAALRGETS